MLNDLPVNVSTLVRTVSPTGGGLERLLYLANVFAAAEGPEARLVDGQKRVSCLI